MNLWVVTVVATNMMSVNCSHPRLDIIIGAPQGAPIIMSNLGLVTKDRHLLGNPALVLLCALPDDNCTVLWLFNVGLLLCAIMRLWITDFVITVLWNYETVDDRFCDYCFVELCDCNL